MSSTRKSYDFSKVIYKKKTNCFYQPSTTNDFSAIFSSFCKTSLNTQLEHSKLRFDDLSF